MSIRQADLPWARAAWLLPDSEQALAIHAGLDGTLTVHQEGHLCAEVVTSRRILRVHEHADWRVFHYRPDHHVTSPTRQPVEYGVGEMIVFTPAGQAEPGPVRDCLQRTGWLEPEEWVQGVAELSGQYSCLALRPSLPAIRSSREFLSEIGELEPTARWLRAQTALLPSGMPDEAAVDRLELAVQEALTNVLMHAYRHEGGHPIRVTLELSGDTCDLRIHHWGERFTPREVTLPPAGVLPAEGAVRFGGFGLYIIAQSVDLVQYGRAGAQSLIRLYTQLRPDAEG